MVVSLLGFGSVEQYYAVWLYIVIPCQKGAGGGGSDDMTCWAKLHYLCLLIKQSGYMNVDTCESP